MLGRAGGVRPAAALGVAEGDDTGEAAVEAPAGAPLAAGVAAAEAEATSPAGCVLVAVAEGLAVVAGPLNAGTTKK